jgi:hypothetical protein
MWSILAACAFDPKQPNAPCHDVVTTPLWVPVLWVLGIVAILVVSLVLILWATRRRQAAASDEDTARRLAR